MKLSSKRLQGEVKYRRAGVKTNLKNIQEYNNLMNKGELRSLDDVWDDNYNLLEQRLTKRLHSKLKKYHNRAIKPEARKQFLNPDAIIASASVELDKHARGTAVGKKKLLAKGHTVESIANDILTERKSRMKTILTQAVDAYRGQESTRL